MQELGGWFAAGYEREQRDTALGGTELTGGADIGTPEQVLGLLLFVSVVFKGTGLVDILVKYTRLYQE